jgi:PadR family transcriptional regulator, regulatory protein PadR
MRDAQLMSDSEANLDALRQELRRGVVVLAVLSQLETGHYGYSLVQLLGERGFAIEEGTLYPLLRRLEKQGVLDSAWDTSEARPRKYYRINDAGRAMLNTLKADWAQTVDVLRALLGP